MRKALSCLGRVVLTFIISVIFLSSGFAYAFKMGDVEISPFISASERYEDNITSVKTDKLHDYITDLSVGVTATGQGKNQELSLKGSLSHEFFAQEKKFDNTSENLSTTYARQLDQYQRASAQESFTHAESPQTFADEFGQTGIRRRSYYLNRFGMDYTKDISKQFSMTAGYQSEIYNPSGADTTDSYLNGVNIRGDYSFSSATIVSSVLGFSQRHYSPGGDIYSSTVDAVLRQFLTKQFYADFMVGISYTKVSAGDSYTEPRYQVSLTDEVSENTRYTWTVQKQYTTNPWNSDVFDQWRTSVDLSHSVYQRLRGTASLFYGEGKYIGENIKNKFTGASGELNYELTPQAAAFLSHTYSKTASTLDSGDYEKNVTMLGIRSRF